jgi:hypothetical protein
MPLLEALSPSDALIRPVIALNVWHFIMEGWMYHCRIGAIRGGKVRIDNTLTKHEFDKLVPPNARWKADNYNHLFEQPTQFYAVALSLAMMGSNSRVDVALAWGYVGLRVVHSIVHSTTNVIMTRFQIFLTLSAVLATLTVRAGLMLFSRM